MPLTRVELEGFKAKESTLEERVIITTDGKKATEGIGGGWSPPPPSNNGIIKAFCLCDWNKLSDCDDDDELLNELKNKKTKLFFFVTITFEADWLTEEDEENEEDQGKQTHQQQPRRIFSLTPSKRDHIEVTRFRLQKKQQQQLWDNFFLQSEKTEQTTEFEGREEEEEEGFKQQVR